MWVKTRPHWINIGQRIVFIVVFSLPTEAVYAARAFTFPYEATVAEEDEREYAQWVTWKADEDADPTFDRFDFRHELELGVTERWQVAFYADWRYQQGSSVDDGAEFRDVAVETIYQLAHPRTEPFGFALYGEIKVGDKLLALEPRLILQKDLGPWIFVWNGTLEAEWEGDNFNYTESKGVFENTLGASYELTSSMRVGIEFIHEIELEEWSDWQDNVLYIGPNIAYRGHEWWVTLTPTFQVTSVGSEANFQTRLIFGIDF
ncbi:MAG: hypothetical protein L0Y67_07805 [Gammaproteobacteria bacterium]|nr:hypothetical protein [Gammaproteobacteria bacterium]MCI0591483.1 hypothetical protein [Gammaproteobacteria bacterium]